MGLSATRIRSRQEAKAWHIMSGAKSCGSPAPTHVVRWYLPLYPSANDPFAVVVGSSVLTQVPLPSHSAALSMHA